MKKILIILLLLTSFACGAHFEYYAGGFSVVGEAYAEDFYYYDGPYSSGDIQTGSVWAENSAAVLQASSLCRSTVISNLDDNSVYIRMFSLAAAISLDSWGYAYGFGGTSAGDGNTLGMFYKIVPDANEELGNEVIVYFTGQVSIEPMGAAPRGNIYAHLIGPPGMEHLAITKGQLPPVTTNPDPNYEVWTMPNVVLYNQSYYGFEKVYPLKAQIGDIIGIFIGAGTGNTCSGYQSGTVISNLTAMFTVEPVLAGDLNGDGDVDFDDFAKLANNWLKNIP